MLKRCLLGTYVGGGEKAEIISYNVHFRAIVARLIKDSILEIHEYVRIFFVSRIKVPIMVLRLRGGAVDPLDNLSPFLLKAVGLNSAIVKEKIN